MIVPRSRGGQRRYQRSKVWAVLVTFGLGWLALKLLPFDAERVVRTLVAPPPGPGEAFAARESGVPVQAKLVIEAPDGVLDPGAAASETRWKARSTAGHPVLLRWDSEVSGPAPAAGDTVFVTGIYEWNPAGGEIQATPLSAKD